MGRQIEDRTADTKTDRQIDRQPESQNRELRCSMINARRAFSVQNVLLLSLLSKDISIVLSIEKIKDKNLDKS